MNTNMVSVFCLAYNHEPYIRRCLDGFVNQQTKFSFEVLIHDDASTDNTANIIREYQAKYPNIIKPIFQTENQHSKKTPIVRTFLEPRATGKYVAFCEGDDFWTDPLKLQKQVDALESQPSCTVCVHTVSAISEDESQVLRTYPFVPVTEGVLSSRCFLEYVLEDYYFQTSSYMFRYECFHNSCVERPSFQKASDVGDTPWLLYAGCHGEAIYLADTMSCYRRGSIGSWTIHMRSQESLLKHIDCEVNVSRAFDEYTEGRYHDLCERRVLKNEFRRHLILEQYRVLFSRVFRPVMKKQSSKFKVKMFLLAFVPGMHRILSRR